MATDLDLAGASGAAMEFLQSSGPMGNTPDPSQPSPDAAPLDPTPVADGQVDPAADPAAPPSPSVAPSDDTKVTLADGTEITVKELRDGYLRQSDYTRKTQTVAQQRQQFEQAVQQAQQEIQSQHQAMQEWLQNPQNIIQLAEQVTGKPLRQFLQGPQINPNEIATVGQAQEYARQQALALQQQMAAEQARIQQWTQEQIQAATQELQTRNEAATYTAKINDTIGGIFKEHEILTAVEGMEDVLRFKVYQRGPQTVEEAQEFFREEAEKQAERLTAQYTKINAAKTANKAKLTAGGIEPPGGTPIQQQPTKFKSLNDKDLQNAATAYLENIGRNK